MFTAPSLNGMLGAGYLGDRCLQDAGRVSWALREGLAGTGASASVWSSCMGESGREAPLPGHPCAFPELLCPPSRGSHFRPTRVPRGGRGSCRLHIRKRVHQGCTSSPCLFNFYAEYITEMLGWMNHKLESRLPGEISITSDMQMTSPLWQKVKRN